MNFLRNLKNFHKFNKYDMYCIFFEYSIRALAVFYTKVFKGNFSNGYFSF